jgi:hypothetical protein
VVGNQDSGPAISLQATSAVLPCGSRFDASRIDAETERSLHEPLFYPMSR